MTEDDALLRSILLAPEDDAPRLVYADWLDEDGEEERAEFVRVQIELTETECCQSIGKWSECVYRPECRYCFLRRRERELWDAHWLDWFPAILDSRQVRRGFVDELRCTMAAFLGGECERCGGAAVDFPETGNPQEPYGPGFPCPACDGEGKTPGAVEVFRTQPVLTCRLTCREPDPDAHTLPSWSWWEVGNGYTLESAEGLPGELFGLLPGVPLFDWGDYRKSYDDRDAALAALSAACVAYGRSLAGLPVPSPASP